MMEGFTRPFLEGQQLEVLGRIDQMGQFLPISQHYTMVGSGAPWWSDPEQPI